MGGCRPVQEEGGQDTGKAHAGHLATYLEEPLGDGVSARWLSGHYWVLGWREAMKSGQSLAVSMGWVMGHQQARTASHLIVSSKQNSLEWRPPYKVRSRRRVPCIPVHATKTIPTPAVPRPTPTLTCSAPHGPMASCPLPGLPARTCALHAPPMALGSPAPARKGAMGLSLGTYWWPPVGSLT